MSGEDTLKSPAEVVAKPVGDSLPSALPVAEPPRAIQFLADYEGCGHWRMIWPEMVLNGYRLATVHSGLGPPETAATCRRNHPAGRPRGVPVR